MEKELTNVCKLAKKSFAPLDIHITGCHYWMPGENETLQKKLKGICLCFDGITHNPYLFGKEYTNQLRIKLLDIAYQAALPEMMKIFPDHEILLDVLPALVRPFLPKEIQRLSTKLSDGSVDVEKDNEVYFSSLEKEIANGNIQPGSTIYRYCKKYQQKLVLKHGRHFISPDSTPVESFRAISRGLMVNSVLELGAGLGICGIAAKKLGINDFTFVDSSPRVCKYLKIKSHCNVLQRDAFNFSFTDSFWDVILVGLPYELNPHLLKTKGKKIFKSCSSLVIQSACMAFFQLEHDWLMGKFNFKDWPWYKPEQTVPFYYPAFAEMAFEWQTCIIAAKNHTQLAIIKREMFERGFKEVKYKYLELEVY